MFPKATLLALVTLVIHAAAVPVESASGISIPLHKRGSLTTAEGVFDHTKAIRASVVTQNKYRQNLLTYTANGGTLRDGAVIKELAVMPSDLTKRQSESLTDENQDTEWAGKISIGTPPKDFLIDFDSTCSSHIYNIIVILIHSL
jgi:cathepsin D